jgi:hypothetical protein
MACQTVLSQKGFRKFATANGFVSPAGNLRTSAEVCYAYMTKNPDFSESHTGLEDVRIEVEIMAWCLRQHKKMSDRVIWNPWHIPQRAGK